MWTRDEERKEGSDEVEVDAMWCIGLEERKAIERKRSCAMQVVY